MHIISSLWTTGLDRSENGLQNNENKMMKTETERGTKREGRKEEGENEAKSEEERN